LRKVGERIPGRVARVLQIRHEQYDGRNWVVYALSDSLRPEGEAVGTLWFS
jgi:hypothetical protein